MNKDLEIIKLRNDLEKAITEAQVAQQMAADELAKYNARIPYLCGGAMICCVGFFLIIQSF